MYLCIYEKDILFADGLPAAGGMAGSADPQRAGLYVVQLPVRPAGGCRADRRWRYFVRRPARLPGAA